MLDTEDASELIELDVSDALLEIEDESEDDAELMDFEAFEAPLEASLLPEENEELAASDKLDADPETAEAADLMLLDAFSTIPGSDPTMEDETFAERRLALSLATEATLSMVP